MRTKIAIVLFMNCICAVSQLNNELNDFFNQNRRGHYLKSELVEWLEYNNLPKDEIYLYAINRTEQDVNFAFYLIQLETQITSEEVIRQENIFFLINKGFKQPSETIKYTLLGFLSKFSDRDFSPQSKSLLASILMNNGTAHMDELIRLCGRLQISSLIPHFESLIINEKIKASLRWNIHLALGRMGDVNYVKKCLKKVQRIGMNDQVVFHLVPDLLYLNNRLCYDYLFQQILLDDLNCTSTNPDSEVEINCAFRLIEMITPHIKEFPVKIYDSGDIITDDYNKTLSEVRNWILKNNYLYEINEL